LILEAINGSTFFCIVYEVLHPYFFICFTTDPSILVPQKNSEFLGWGAFYGWIIKAYSCACNKFFCEFKSLDNEVSL
jgi:hypothetical protein